MAKKRAHDDADDELLDALYTASPRAFVSERARVVAELKAAGRGDEARAVGRRTRPSASVWAVNQLARRAADEVGELLALGASLRAGERDVLRGGDAAGFMAQARSARQKVAALARRAEAIVAESGQQATMVLGRKIAATLQAASIGDDETRARLAAGRLEADLSPPSSFGGEGDLSAALAASAGAKAGARKESDAHARSTHEKRAHGAAHDERAHDERAHDERAHDRTTRRDGAAERARARAERARAAAELRTQRRAQAAARKQAAALARAAVAAERTVAERTRAVERAKAAVEHAEAELRTAKDALAEAELDAAAARRAAAAAARS